MEEVSLNALPIYRECLPTDMYLVLSVCFRVSSEEELLFCVLLWQPHGYPAGAKEGYGVGIRFPW